MCFLSPSAAQTSVVWFFHGTLLVGDSPGCSWMPALSVVQFLFAGVGQLTS